MQRLGIAFLAIALLLASHAQSQQTPQAPGPVKTQTVPGASAPLPPSPDHAPILDQGTTPVPSNSTSPIVRTLRRMEPNCLDAIFHLCWSFPPSDGPLYKSYAQWRIAEDFELGDDYFKRKNYRGAEFRFEDVLQLEPDNPEATLKLGEALQNLGRNAEACTQYKRYLEIAPDAAFSDRAKKSLQKRSPCPSTLVQ